VPAQEADRRQSGKDRLLGEEEQRNNIENLYERLEKKPKGQREKSPPVPGEEKEGLLAQGLLKASKRRQSPTPILPIELA